MLRRLIPTTFSLASHRLDKLQTGRLLQRFRSTYLSPTRGFGSRLSSRSGGALPINTVFENLPWIRVLTLALDNQICPSARSMDRGTFWKVPPPLGAWPGRSHARHRRYQVCQDVERSSC